MCNITLGNSNTHCVYESNGSIPLTNNSYNEDTGMHHTSNAVTMIKATAMCVIILLAVFGNTLVIISVWKFSSLRTTAHAFIISLAVSDLLVALLAMPFNAVQVIRGQWMFNKLMCNIYNANDVLFSTASILNLCCISVERFLPILNPYPPNGLTRCQVVVMLICVWGFSSLISHIPIHTGLYTNEVINIGGPIQHGICVFEVNKIYAAISSSISFWIPGVIIIVMNINTYRLAAKHLMGNHGSHSKVRMEMKLAKTLGIIMACFLLCWLPFFLWYVISTFCGPEKCPTPGVVEDILFWVGYFNSAMNPIIYAFHNKNFQKAFRELLKCYKLKCCSTHRPLSYREEEIVPMQYR